MIPIKSSRPSLNSGLPEILLVSDLSVHACVPLLGSRLRIQEVLECKEIGLSVTAYLSATLSKQALAFLRIV